MTVEPVILRTKFGTTLYLTDPGDRGKSVWHIERVSDPLSDRDTKEIEWACERLWLDKRATFTAIRNALKAAR